MPSDHTHAASARQWRLHAPFRMPQLRSHYSARPRRLQASRWCEEYMRRKARDKGLHLLPFLPFNAVKKVVAWRAWMRCMDAMHGCDAMNGVEVNDLPGTANGNCRDV